MQWHYVKEGQQLGPVSEEELQRLAQQGEIKPDDLVWNPNFADEWLPASSVDKLFTTPSSILPPPDTVQSLFGNGQAGPAPSDGKVIRNRKLQKMARESLHNNWKLAVAVTLLF